MYGTFEGWIQTNALPWETYDEAKERYEKLYGEDEPLDFSEDPEPVYEPEVVEEKKEEPKIEVKIIEDDTPLTDEQVVEKVTGTSK